MAATIAGLLLGLVQMPVLYRHVHAPLVWVFASAAGWLVLGWLIGFALARLTDMLALGTVPAVFTGLALIGLWRVSDR